MRKISRIWFAAVGLIVVAAVAIAVVLLTDQTPVAAEAPEADKVLSVQANMPFQILIPGYLPKGFNRAEAEIKLTDTGPGGEPIVEIAYRNRRGATIFVREWVPVNPALETLAGSRPVETKWGKGYLLTQGQQTLSVLWADIGPLRVSVFTHNLDVVSREQILGIMDTMGPASNRQVFTFQLAADTEIKAVAAPPPVQIELNAEGIQELTLVVTPGGYTPIRFAVKKDVPVRLHFRMIGQVGCGNVLSLPIGTNEMVGATLFSQDETKTLDFTPREVGEFQFYCAHYMFRGIMTVTE